MLPKSSSLVRTALHLTPTARVALVVFLSLAVATPVPFAAAEEGSYPILATGEPISPVFVLIPEAIAGIPMGCAGSVSLTVRATGAEYPAVVATLTSNGCAGDLCDGLRATKAYADCEERPWGLAKHPLFTVGANTPFVEAMCLRKATLQLDLDGDGRFDVRQPGLATVALGGC